MNILIAYYSMTGSVHELALAIAEGAKSAGAEVRVRQVKELVPDADIEKRPASKRTRELKKSIPFATHDDLRWADGVAFGSPTRYGNMCSQLKQFIDGTGSLWLSGALVGKAACVFTSTATQHGGQESTLLSMMVPLFHLGFVVVGLPYSETDQMSLNHIHGGSPYGVSSISGPENSLKPTDIDLKLARAQGRRLADVAEKLRIRKPAEKKGEIAA